MKKMKTSLVAQLKKDEPIFDTSVRGRIIFSPPDYIVLFLGALNHYYIKLLKHIFP